MKNFKYLPDQHFTYFQQIVNAKQNTVKTKPNEKKAALILISAAIKTKYEHYESNFDKIKLHLIEDSTYAGLEKISLLDTYTGNGKQLDAMKTAIKKLQHVDWQNTCPYCGILSPNSTDHYLPKDNYPEYAVLAINLIPCCLECNGKKGDYWRLNHKRKIINFYLDEIPTQEFLTCNITYENGIPVARYKLVHNEGIRIESFEMITSHFARLNLLERYKEASNDEITNTLDSITAFSMRFQPHEIKEDLKSFYNKTVSRFGQSHWRCALMKGMFNSEEFVQYVSLKIKAEKIESALGL
ncbi:MULTISPECIES: HNH endonuclease [Pseudomonas]|uniref:Uncharacterized protein n=1 Tax=Pseudomonas umsongensis TaxID=198618 RepID=A0ACC5MI52_9PSED|nr:MULTISPECIES: HNH endonuclease [Pseudomonas]MBB2888356.1 hypothetical protein [Pseudomonas umsongensis]NMN75912.1 hypothetical protein [Pseudomonas sp. KD5]